jgi:anaphase-promoting complex subunit 2
MLVSPPTSSGETFAQRLLRFHQVMIAYTYALDDFAAHSLCGQWNGDAFMSRVVARIQIDHESKIRSLVAEHLRNMFAAWRKSFSDQVPVEEKYQSLQEDDVEEEEEEAEAEEDTDMSSTRPDEEGYVHASEAEVPLLNVEYFASIMQGLNMLPLCQEQCWAVLEDRLNHLIASLCLEEFGVSFCEQLLQWVSVVAQPFLDSFEGGPASANMNASTCTVVTDASKPVRDLSTTVFTSLCDCRIQMIFDIIVDYPESLPAVRDLHRCLEKCPSMYRQLQSALETAIAIRLLQPGAKTIDIVNTYVSAVRVVSALDSSRTMLRSLSDRVGGYLKQRPDAIRSIVLGMVEEDGDLYPDLLRYPQSGTSAVHTGNEVADSPSWEPLPVEAGVLAPAAAAASLNASFSAVDDTPAVDVIALLIQMLGNKENLMNEYRSVLATKLLSKGDFDVDFEIRVHELLKLRFGEKSLHACDVMLKDVADSKRLSSALLAKSKVSGLIVSHTFWSSIVDEASFEPHEAVAEMLLVGQEFYKQQKAPRKLLFKKSLGVVTLDVQLVSGDIVPVSTNPVAASVLLYVAEDASSTGLAWRSLASVTKLSEEVLQKKCAPLFVQRVLVPSSDNTAVRLAVSVSEMEDEDATMGQSQAMAEDDSDNAASQATQAENAIFESFVSNMLENLGPMPLDRIHNMLKMYCMDPPYDRTVDQLQVLLSRMIHADAIDKEGANYRLKS